MKRGTGRPSLMGPVDRGAILPGDGPGHCKARSKCPEVQLLNPRASKTCPDYLKHLESRTSIDLANFQPQMLGFSSVLPENHKMNKYRRKTITNEKLK